MSTTIPTQGEGGCDARYAAHACVWGRSPDPIVPALLRNADLRGRLALDAGCGEGRHARVLTEAGARVRAVDVSALAIEHGRSAAWACAVIWEQGDVRTLPLRPRSLDAVVACALLHWLPGKADVRAAVERLQEATRPGGLHALTAFNDRVPYEPPAGESRSACLLAHDWYLQRYAGWDLLEASDTDSTGSHPGHPELHTHAVTRLLARRPS